MHRFYVNDDQIKEEEIIITGPDVNHIKNVLRMKQGEELVICNGQGKDCYCIISMISDSEITARIESSGDTNTELLSRVTLYQGLPKKDKMEWIIQKAVELGVHEIVPVMTSRSIVKLEDKKKELKKLERWQSIAESAAKQSRRGYIPRIRPVLSFQNAVKEAGSLDLSLVPYEKSEGMQKTRDHIRGIRKDMEIGIMIGPEGGFEESEIQLAKEAGIHPISLGRRILRTETAGLAVLSMMVLVLED